MPKAKPRWKLHRAEANVDEAMRALIGEGPEAHSPSEWIGLCNQLKLQALFPGQWVAWRDHYEGEGMDSRLVWREILFVGPNSSVVSRKLQRFSDEEMYGVFMDYIEAPDEILRLH